MYPFLTISLHSFLVFLLIMMLKYVGKTWFVSHTIHMQQKIYGSPSFAIDNMYYLILEFKNMKAYHGAMKFKTKD